MSMPLHFASPFNCVYSAKKLKENPRYPETEVMGTGAFKFVEYVKGSHWRAVRFDQYFRKDRPYLDGYKVFFVKSGGVVSGMIGGQFDVEFRGRRRTVYAKAENLNLTGSIKDRMALHILREGDQVDVGPGARGAGDEGQPALPETERLQDVDADLDLLNGISRERHADRVTDSLGQEGPYADR